MKLTVYGKDLECTEEMRCVADCYTEQDAQTIAHRVNCFEELVAALEAANHTFRAIGWHDDGPAKARVSAALERAKQ